MDSGALMEDDGYGNESRDGPPEHEAKFQDQLREIELRSYPRKYAPDKGSAENAEHPTGSGDDPQKSIAAGTLHGFLGAEADAQLGAGGEIARNGYGHGTEGVKEFPNGRDLRGTVGALAQVRVEPGLIVSRESFDERLGEELLRSLMEVLGHAAPWGKADFRASRPR